MSWTWVELTSATENALPEALIPEGSTGCPHHEGDKYSPDDSVWITPGFTNESYRPECIWHWLEYATVIVPANTESALVDYFVITEKNSNPLRYIRYTHTLTAAQYDVRISIYDDASISTGTTDVCDVYWEWYSEIITDDFIYPNVALLGIRSVATSKLANTIPRISCLATRSYVYVYDPDTSTWVQKAATNPAWACYDILVGAQNVTNISTNVKEIMTVGSVDHARVDYDAFEAWATWCDLVAPADYPDKKAYTCNIYMDTTTNLRKALDIVGLLGRGAVVQQGHNWTCVVEMPESTPIQRFSFNMANIERDSYQEQWLPMSDRANCVQVTYYDSTNDYKSATVEVRQIGYDESEEEVKMASVELKGCTNKDMATMYGKFLLNCNRYLTMTASWTAFTDAIACFPGQIIEVQHDVPQFGYGGRLLAGCTTTSLLLDTTMTMVSGKVYHVVIYHTEDDLREEKTVTTVAGTFSTIGLTSALTRAPSVDTRFSFGEVISGGEPWENWKVSKLMRVLSITYASDLRRKITAIEFVNSVFEDGAIVYPVNPSDLSSLLFPPPLKSVTLELTWKFNSTSQDWKPYLRITFIPDPATDYQNLASPISKIKCYVHGEPGNTSTTVCKTYEKSFDSYEFVVDVDAETLNGTTLYATAALVNKQNVESNKCAASVLYINTVNTPTVTLNTEIDTSKGTYGFDYYTSSYSVYLKWNPVGWSLVGGKWAPIKTWNNGNNYYVYKCHVLLGAFVTAQDEIPAWSTVVQDNTSGIGDIYNSAGVEITDPDTLNSICIGATTHRIDNLQYSDKWIALATAPLLKTGQTCSIDHSDPALGVDWEYIHVTCAGGTGSTVEDVQITNAELIITQQGNQVVLNEIAWDYTLGSPNIDGFCFVTRTQSYWWSWTLSTTLSSSVTDITTLLNSVDFTTGDGMTAANDFVARYQEWAARGTPYFYFMLSDASFWEVMKIDTATLTITRGVEGTTARSWSTGAVWSYCPCEGIDTCSWLPTPDARAYTFNPGVPVNFALHFTMFAAKASSTAPGYKRCHYAFWDIVRNR